MTYALPGTFDALAGRAAFDAPPQVVAAPDLVFVPRSNWQWVVFLPALVFCALGWAGGGIASLTDLGFLIFTVACGVYLTLEFFYFPRRFGVGGLVLYGGTLCWFCQDYFTHWFNHDFNDTNLRIRADTIAKTATLVVAFTMFMSAGLNIRRGRWVERCILAIPDPESMGFYICLVLAMFVIGISPYFLFNAEPWYLALFHSAFAGWTGGAQLTVSRSGNLNYNWGAYVAQILQVGQVGGIFALMYAILIARTTLQRAFSLLIWTYWLLFALAGDRRGDIAFQMMPLVCMVFIKYQAQAAHAFKKFSVRAYAACGVLTLLLLFVVQFQGEFRGVGFANADLTKISLTKNQGNTMFSEGLLGFAMIPDKHGYFANDYEVDGFLRAIPETVFYAVIGMVPRALWHDKPVDQLWAWYNRAYIGSGNGTSGTTISHGLVGSWYFKYGLWGVVEGGLFVGWLMGVGERALQHSNGEPLGILMSLAFTVWLFRIFRDFIFLELYPLIIGGVVLGLLVWLLKPMLNPVSASTTGV